MVGRDYGSAGAVLNAERPHVHSFAANAHAAIAKNTARTIEIDHRRPLLLVFVQLGFHEARFGGAISEGHVLQFAFAACVADWAIERMISQQEFQSRLARLANFVGCGMHHHAFGDRHRARRLHLRHLLDFD